VFRPGDGTDVVTDFSHAQGDRIDLRAFDDLHSFDSLSSYLSFDGPDTVIDFHDGQKITVQNAHLTTEDILFHQLHQGYVINV
jgi:hypothetical protein